MFSRPICYPATIIVPEVHGYFDIAFCGFHKFFALRNPEFGRLLTQIRGFLTNTERSVCLVG